mgnify:CR=1 FL=1
MRTKKSILKWLLLLILLITTAVIIFRNILFPIIDYYCLADSRNFTVEIIEKQGHSNKIDDELTGILQEIDRFSQKSDYNNLIVSLGKNELLKLIRVILFLVLSAIELAISIAVIYSFKNFTIKILKPLCHK